MRHKFTHAYLRKQKRREDTKQLMELVLRLGVDAAEVAVEKNKKILEQYFPQLRGHWTSQFAAVSDIVGT